MDLVSVWGNTPLLWWWTWRSMTSSRRSAVIETLGNALTNKYSDGLPRNRTTASTSSSTRSRTSATHAPYSGSPANFTANTAVLNPHDRIMSLDLPSGGHLTGYCTSGGKKISTTSICGLASDIDCIS